MFSPYYCVGKSISWAVDPNVLKELLPGKLAAMNDDGRICIADSTRIPLGIIDDISDIFINEGITYWPINGGMYSTDVYESGCTFTAGCMIYCNDKGYLTSDSNRGGIPIGICTRAPAHIDGPIMIQLQYGMHKTPNTEIKTESKHISEVDKYKVSYKTDYWINYQPTPDSDIQTFYFKNGIDFDKALYKDGLGISWLLLDEPVKLSCYMNYSLPGKSHVDGVAYNADWLPIHDNMKSNIWRAECPDTDAEYPELIMNFKGIGRLSIIIDPSADIDFDTLKLNHKEFAVMNNRQILKTYRFYENLYGDLYSTTIERGCSVPGYLKQSIIDKFETAYNELVNKNNKERVVATKESLEPSIGAAIACVAAGSIVKALSKSKKEKAQFAYAVQETASV